MKGNHTMQIQEIRSFKIDGIPGYVIAERWHGLVALRNGDHEVIVKASDIADTTDVVFKDIEPVLVNVTQHEPEPITTATAIVVTPAS